MYQPVIANSTFSLGFAGHDNTRTSSCRRPLVLSMSYTTSTLLSIFFSLLDWKCYQFARGAAHGKTMIDQVINVGASEVAFKFL